jgi:hypothetical protein
MVTQAESVRGPVLYAFVPAQVGTTSVTLGDIDVRQLKELECIESPVADIDRRAGVIIEKHAAVGRRSGVGRAPSLSVCHRSTSSEIYRNTNGVKIMYMTLIATVISKYGIVQASDSNLSGETGSVATGKKVFPLGFTNGALALAGASSVDGQSMDTWMPDCLAIYGATTEPTLAGFAQYLADRLGHEMREGEWQGGGMIQIVGYDSRPPGVHPELWFVQNVTDIQPMADRTWHVSEEFWTSDYRKIGTRMALASGLYHQYFSGITPGHVAFGDVSQLLHEFFQQAWEHQTWKFRAPSSLDELAPIVELSIRAIGTLYRCSNYPAPYVGGEVQVEKLIPPRGAVEL